MLGSTCTQSSPQLNWPVTAPSPSTDAMPTAEMASAPRHRGEGELRRWLAGVRGEGRRLARRLGVVVLGSSSRTVGSGAIVCCCRAVGGSVSCTLSRGSFEFAMVLPRGSRWNQRKHKLGLTAVLSQNDPWGRRHIPLEVLFARAMRGIKCHCLVPRLRRECAAAPHERSRRRARRSGRSARLVQRQNLRTRNAVLAWPSRRRAVKVGSPSRAGPGPPLIEVDVLCARTS